MGESRRGYLEDIEGSWLEKWRTWSFLTSWLMFFTLRNIPWKFCVDISIRSVPRRGRSKSGVLGGCWRFLTGDMDERVIPDVMNFYDDILTGSVWKRGVKKVGTWRKLRVPGRILRENGHPWCRGWPYFTSRKMPRTICSDIFVGSVPRMDW